MRIDYGVLEGPLVISERKKKMVAGAAGRSDRSDRATGRPGWQFGACAIHIYTILIC
jgi:hypothetical protein